MGDEAIYRGRPRGQPRELTLIETPYPPFVDQALGYVGSARWVGIYDSGRMRDPAEDPMRITDGSGYAHGNRASWMVLITHDAVAPHVLALGFRSDSEDPEDKDWLLLDRSEQRMYLATGANVVQFLADRQEPGPAPATDARMAATAAMQKTAAYSTDLSDLDADELLKRVGRNRNLFMSDWLAEWLDDWLEEAKA